MRRWVYAHSHSSVGNHMQVAPVKGLFKNRLYILTKQDINKSYQADQQDNRLNCSHHIRSIEYLFTDWLRLSYLYPSELLETSSTWSGIWFA